MASDQGPIATEGPLVNPSAPTVAGLAAPVSSDAFAADGVRANTLKRPRDDTPTSPSTNPHADFSPSKIAKLSDYTRSLAPPLTGQAAIEDEQRRKEEEARLHPPDAISDNPAQKALYALRGAQAAMSRLSEDPAAAYAAAAIDGAPKTADIAAAVAASAEHQASISPHSATSGQSLEGAHHVVDSPAPMEIDGQQGERPTYALQPEAQMEDKPGAMSYPGILPPDAAMGTAGGPQRGMSLPMSGSQQPDLAPRSPSNKKHKCPYCDTEFTRHHNLKSHLLTHSQEKPYVCQECHLRFRRLHDLKRHSKLHTGEKPHICPRCDRKFARGDALARHTKGAGGCAGRRSSMGGGFGDDDYDGATDADDSAMTGMYDAGEADMTEEDRRRLSLPAAKAQHVPGGQPAPESFAAPHGRTYPPPSQRPATGGGLFPPNVDRPQAAGAAGASPKAPAPGFRRQADLPVGHSAAPRPAGGPSNGQAAAGDTNNLFSSETGLWAYIQTLEERLRSQDERTKHQEERIVLLETAKTGHEAQISYLANEVNNLRAQLHQIRAAEQEGK